MMHAMEIAYNPLDKKLPNFVVVSPDASASEALVLMHKFKIHHLIVLDDGPERGLISDRDLIAYAVKHHRWENLSSIKVEDVADYDAPKVSDAMDLREVLGLMAEREASAVLVFQEEHLSGILTESDIFRAFHRLHIKSSPVEDLLAKSEVLLSAPLAQSFMVLLS
jgi:CBS domain-containing protein